MEKKDQIEHTKIFQQKKAWITPEIFDSPVITVTEGGGDPQNAPDVGGYS